VADRLLAAALETGETASFGLPPSAAGLEPGDAVLLPTGLGLRRFRVERVVDDGARRVEARRVEAKGRPAARSEPRAAAPALPLREPPEIWAMDLPNAEGLTLAAFAEPWPGPIAVQREEADGALTLAGLIERPSALGALTAPLAAGRPWRWDGSPLRVRLFGGAPQSRSAEAVLAGANLAALEGPEGWEVVQFVGAALVGPDEWSLGPLLLGCFGTEFAAGPREPGARFALLDGAALTLPAEPGEALRLRVGPAHLPADDPAHVALDVVAAGAWLRPLSPIRLEAVREGGGLRLSWVRRTRTGGDAWGAVEPPVGEEREIYRVTARKSGAAMRVEDVAAPSFFYDAGAMAADGAAGRFEVGVAQLSARFGPGPEARIWIDE
jgi:hypothetical protein